MLSIVNDNITIGTLADCMPDLFGHLSDKEDLARRVKIEALYQFAIDQQKEQVTQIRNDESLVIPPEVDYTS